MWVDKGWLATTVVTKTPVDAISLETSCRVYVFRNGRVIIIAQPGQGKWVSFPVGEGLLTILFEHTTEGDEPGSELRGHQVQVVGTGSNIRITRAGSPCSIPLFRLRSAEDNETEAQPSQRNLEISK